METSAFFNRQARGDWVRLRTLVTLRWIAIAGQTAAVLVASQLMGVQLPLTLCAALISISVCVNLVSQLVHPAEKRLSEFGTLLSLCFDMVQLVALLIATGGLDNPFAMLLLAPVTISASALRLRSTLVLGLGALAAVGLMSTAALPLVLADGTALRVPPEYRTGVLAALAIAVVFLSLYARRVAVEAFAMSEALAATQLALAREQRLSAIGAMAAAAAHEFGTPLATIKLAAGELARELTDRPELAEDVALIRREAERCGQIMAGLSKDGQEDRHLQHAPISAVIDEAAEPHRARGKRLIFRLDGAPADLAQPDQPLVRRSPELIHGLRNVIQNAVDFATSTVWIDVETGQDSLRIAVGDDGPGFADDIMPRLGEPYVTSREPQAPGRAASYAGMGLGLFIARTLLERTGARLAFANGGDGWARGVSDPPADLARPSGAIIEMVWSPARLVTPRDIARAPGPRGPRAAALRA